MHWQAGADLLRVQDQLREEELQQLQVRGEERQQLQGGDQDWLQADHLEWVQWGLGQIQHYRIKIYVSGSDPPVHTGPCLHSQSRFSTSEKMSVWKWN